MSFSSNSSSHVNQLPVTVEIPKDEVEFYDYLTLHIKRVSQVVNTKAGGLYSLQEYFNSKQYYTLNNPNQFRNVYQTVFDLVNLNGGNIGGAATVSFPHNIQNLKYGTLIYAGCTSTTPTYFSVMGQPTIYLDSVNLHFTNPIATPLSSVIVVAEYLKN